MNEHTRKRSPRPLLLAAFAVPGLAQSATECDVAAFVANPYGTVEIHADADVSSPIVGKLPPSPGGTLVLLKGARKDWINVASAVDATRTRVFDGAGWIHAPQLAVRTIDPHDDLVPFHASPDRKSEILGSLRAELDVNLLACSDDWMKIVVPVRGGEDLEGWLPRGSWCGSPWEDCM